MKTLLVFFVFALVSATPVWENDFEKARIEAGQEHKLILLNFCGSDWCGPCIRMRNEIFGSSAFSTYAADHLVLIRADFPRQKKNQLDKDQVKRNEALAEKYNPQGKFPLTLLINADGKVLKQWEGLPAMSAEEFTEELRKVNYAGK